MSKKQNKIDPKIVLYVLGGVIIGIIATYFFLNNPYQERWYTGWECLYWNTTQGFVVSGAGQYVNFENQTVFATWEQLGYDITKCVKYVYIKQTWEINNTI